MKPLTMKTTETAKLLGINWKTAWGIIRRNQLYGHANRLRGGPRNCKVDQEMINHMVAIVEDHPEYTLGQINAKLHFALPNKPANYGGQDAEEPADHTQKDGDGATRSES